jgi:hypothetical protein
MQPTPLIHPHGVYSSDDLSQLLDASPETLLAARRSGALRGVRKGRRLVYLGSWVLAWLNSDPVQAGEVRRAHP